MSAPAESPRVAIVQQPMAWTTAENVEVILAALATAAGQGAALAVFPELALTGFHRRIRDQAVDAIVAPAMHRVVVACRRHQVACAIGLPTFGDTGGAFNSHAFIDANGHLVATVSKNGLTPAELTFFAAGTDRPVFAFHDMACSTVLCREMDDADAVVQQLASAPVDLIIWPSMVGNPPGTVHPDPEDTDDLGYVKRTASMARRLGAIVVQSNWPQALNTPDATYLGESKVYGRDGEILLTLPRDEAGIGVFNVGARDCRWIPLSMRRP